MKYVTYKTIYEGSMLPSFYIGSTSETKAMSGKYFGSITSKKWAKIFRAELTNNPHLFSLEILSYHDTREEALIEENRLQFEHDAIKSDLYFNEAYASGKFGADVTGEKNPFFGKRHSEEFRKKQSVAMKGKDTWMKGKNHSDESKRKMSDSKKGRDTWNKGMKNSISEETRQKMKASQLARRMREKFA